MVNSSTHQNIPLWPQAKIYSGQLFSINIWLNPFPSVTNILFSAIILGFVSWTTEWYQYFFMMVYKADVWENNIDMWIGRGFIPLIKELMNYDPKSKQWKMHECNFIALDMERIKCNNMLTVYLPSCVMCSSYFKNIFCDFSLFYIYLFTHLFTVKERLIICLARAQWSATRLHILGEQLLIARHASVSSVIVNDM